MSDIAFDAPEDEVKLEDFKIKKVIDKGSFGKVFLVVHLKTGRELARVLCWDQRAGAARHLRRRDDGQIPPSAQVYAAMGQAQG